MRADLHTHSTASDGLLTPTELIKYVASLDAEVVSITDHDTVDGLDEGIEAARDAKVEFVPGIEISARSKTEIHILGYNIDYRNKDFVNFLEEIKDMRRSRNILIGKKLKELGVALNIDFEEKGLGRKNIANAMVEEGIVRTISEAFDCYLGTEGKAYVEAKRVTPLAAVKFISDFGGIPVIAHPKKFHYDKTLTLLIEGLKPVGLRGIETYYPGHTECDILELLGLAKRYGLIPTGGSDYHGDDEKSFIFDLPIITLRALKIRAKK